MNAGGDAPARAFAPAKINLYLHVVGRRADGYHLLDSLVAFADIGDRVTAAPADRLSLATGGPEAAALAGLGDDNLVLRAAQLLAAAVAQASPAGKTPGAALELEKILPVASGIGGGSSDAAAALRALGRLWRPALAPESLAALALRLGADVPACLACRPVWVSGIGDGLEPVTGLPPAGIVLANPRRGLPTAAVFQARSGDFTRSGRFAPMPRDADGLAAALAACRNDLTTAALGLVPEIAAVLLRLARLPGALLARMSGSGASCFALFPDRAAALAAGAELAEAEPGWWSAAGALLSEAPADA
ncbi:MAG TPA: 4-(cytidine 5'-diphospho)-2-C-methyl-D-erythritol kinase [Stellaceae bacterium]|nr:4-(cytidine 5'-diphospho)-2-C-methyl-D-erythritol kinase [Stellaceae bacterium]